MTGFGAPCGACKFLRRKCSRGCVFAPYFCSEQGTAHFAAIHKVFGASNFSKLLMCIPIHDRGDAVVTISYQAQARIQDPIHGCVAHIFALQQQVVNLQAQVASLKASQGFVNSSNAVTAHEQKNYNKFPTFQYGEEGFIHEERMVESLIPLPSINTSNYMNELFYSCYIQSTNENYNSFSWSSPSRNTPYYANELLDSCCIQSTDQNYCNSSWSMMRIDDDMQ